MKYLLVLLTWFSCSLQAQEAIQINDYQPDALKPNVTVEELYSDAHQSSFLIWVQDSVKPHHHASHTECIYVLEGSGTFYIGKEKMELKPGDFVTIPEGAIHSFKNRSAKPAKVLSIQTPEFTGEDRIWSTEQH